MDLNAILQLLQNKLPCLSAAYLFGSHAQNSQGPDSDLDLAILVDGPSLDPIALWELSGELADIAGCAVDLIDLRAASTVLQYQIITTGRRLWAGNAEADLYESFILSEKTALDTARSALLSDITKEGRIHAR
jgi:predicted nucleotidyltransferase